ncbi:TolB family protein [Actinocrispum wychmicini]|uniref:WD40 repeat protein n=1 Tax=Actinocrispum wychmicini TaxID=1213861 RepID=A0A4R2JI49_9PSEU|nr:hypothetical protein [Actinocrispum wychmicini]TCO53795.1 hypothetical protein EV192_110387 [Actinocrispum wychmicini]
MSTRVRVWLAVGATVVLAAVAVIYVLAVRTQEAAGTTQTVTLKPGQLIARSTTDGHLISVVDGVRAVSPLTCARVYAAGGTGLCLRQDGDLTTYQLAVLHTDLTVAREIPLVGLPNRARVSPTGRMVTWTVFVTGDSYNGGQFSTRAGILDTTSDQLVGTLEDFTVTLNGKPYQAQDENFWGVTFTKDDNTFYATMSTAGKRYLVQGDFAKNTIKTLLPNIECPSLSPNGTKIAYKAAIEADPTKGWRLSILDLTTSTITPLAETRSVDDQPAWINENTIAYAIPKAPGKADIWTIPTNGTGKPQILLPDAESPAALN